METNDYVSYDKILETLHRLFPSMSIMEKSGLSVMPTICHHGDVFSGSHKLYLYENEGAKPMFQCYTHCSESFDVHELLIRHYAERGEEINFRDTLQMIYGEEYLAQQDKSFVPDDKQVAVINQIANEIEKQYQDPTDVRLPEYTDVPILNLFRYSTLNPWLAEGFTQETLEKWHIQYSPMYNTIAIPHYDYRGRRIGIRGRFFEERDLEFGKYRPLYDRGLMYNHPLAFSLYGIHLNQQNIIDQQTVILFEGEKSVMLYGQYFPNRENISLAVCGSSISEWQQQMLSKYLRVKRVLIAFDKEYNNFMEWFTYKEKIAEKVKFLSSFAEIFIIYDGEGLLDFKDSPIDKGPEVFSQLQLERI